MSDDRILPRRTFLRGLGAVVALPALDAMAPRATRAASAARAAEERAAPVPGASPDFAPVAPIRMAFVYVPNGAHMPDWTPSKEGTDFDLPPSLEILRPFQDDMLVLSGLTQDKARPNGDGPGDHARAAAAFLTGCQPFKTHGAGIRVGVSVDQVAAAAVGHETLLPSLEIGCEAGVQSGNCDSGYSCAYSSNISWKTESMPLAKEVNPRLVFERLFGGGAGEDAARGRARRLERKRSILDFVREDAARLRGDLGATDRRKLDEYLTAVRELEGRIERDEKGRAAAAVAEGHEPPAGIPREYAEHIRIQSDLLVLAFRADATRIATFMMANEGSNRSYKSIGVSEGHHDLSHHGNEKEKQEKIARINRFHLSEYAYLLGKLRETREGEESLLDRCMILYGSGIGDGNRHNHDDLPIVLAGKGGGTIAAGRHVRYPRNTPLNDLFLCMLDRMGAPTEKLGDSRGRLPGLEG